MTGAGIVAFLDNAVLWQNATGNQQIESAPTGITTNVWDYENMRSAVLLPSGSRETMTYNADLRMAQREV
jgi:hypothetical protein